MLFALVVATQDEDIRITLGLLLVTALIPIALIDLDVRLIPNKITLPASIAALVAGLTLDIDFVPEQLIAAPARSRSSSSRRGSTRAGWGWAT